MNRSDDRDRPATQAVTGGRRKEWAGAVVNPPVWRGSTHLYDDCADLAAGRPDEDGHFYYGRRGSPTQWSLADALTAMEPGAHGTLLYPSGVAAIAGALLGVLKQGDVLLMTDNVYEPSRTMARTVLKPLGIETRFFDPLDIEAYRALFCENTRAVLLESPGSLTMEVCDIPALAGIAREAGATSLIDNTWATMLGFPALERGCDISIMSLTKHVGGHSDLLMGSVAAGKKLYRKLRRTYLATGQVVSPDDAALAARGLRTLPLRLRQSTESAFAVASFLREQEQVADILCPMLAGAPGHEFWSRDFAGGCGLFSFVLEGRTPAHRARFIDALRLFGIGFSWGGFESLAIPFDPQRARSVMQWPPAGSPSDNRLGIRLSIGLEDPQDLVEDIAQALAAMDET